MLSLLIPFLIIGVIFWFLLSRMQGGGSRVMGFGKSKAKLVTKDTPQVTFADVAGADEAVEELHEIKEFLAEPAKFQAVGAKIPKGVLLYGPPGTGKTLLARAVAGEAGVPFYSISGSDFVEMFVGVGASACPRPVRAGQGERAGDHLRRRDRRRRPAPRRRHGRRARRARADAQPDARRDGRLRRQGERHPHRRDEPPRHPRPRAAAPGPLRPPGRRRGPRPQGPRRRSSRCTPRASRSSTDVDLAAVARRTPGFTGADLANVLNEAALLTARSGAQLIDDRALDEAIDRVIAGPQKRTRIMNDQGAEDHRVPRGRSRPGRRRDALHRPGHQGDDPAARPRPRLHDGHAVEDKYSTTRNELLDQLAYAMGGRVAEELVFHDPTTGASNDIEKATAIARKMVTSSA